MDGHFRYKKINYFGKEQSKSIPLESPKLFLFGLEADASQHRKPKISFKIQLLYIYIYIYNAKDA